MVSVSRAHSVPLEDFTKDGLVGLGLDGRHGVRAKKRDTIARRPGRMVKAECILTERGLCRLVVLRLGLIVVWLMKTRSLGLA